MSTLTHDAAALILPDVATGKRPVKSSAPSTEPAAPIGYRWISRRWRVRPDGTRDYAALHGKTAFNVLLPVSSRLHRVKR